VLTIVGCEIGDDMYRSFVLLFAILIEYLEGEGQRFLIILLIIILITQSLPIFGDVVFQIHGIILTEYGENRQRKRVGLYI